MENIQNEFDGVFRFTNWTNEDYKPLWNNKEYTFPAGKMTPMILQGVTPEEVQSIRKLWAKKLAVREFHKGEVYNNMKDQGRGHPATYDEKILEPLIQRCLEPLPLGKIEVKEIPRDEEKGIKASEVFNSNNPIDMKANRPTEALNQVF